MSIDVTVKTRFTAIGNAAPGKLSEIVRRTAFDIEAGAKQRSPVDTGFLRASIYTVTDKDNGYSKAKSEAKGKNPKAEFADAEGNVKPLEAIVAVGAEYGIHVEYGARSAPAQPFLTPAVEAVKGQFEREIKKALEG
jgi:HK97 gp10 family phage protein